MTRVRVEPRSCDQDRRKNDAFNVEKKFKRTILTNVGRDDFSAKFFQANGFSAKFFQANGFSEMAVFLQSFLFVSAF